MSGKQIVPASRVARTLVECFEQKPFVRGLIEESGESLIDADYQRIDREEIWLRWVQCGSAIAGVFPPGDSVGMDLTDYLCVAACKHLAQPPVDAGAQYVEKNLAYIVALQPLKSPFALGDAFFLYCRVKVSDSVIKMLLRSWATQQIAMHGNYLAHVRDNFRILPDLHL